VSVKVSLPYGLSYYPTQNPLFWPYGLSVPSGKFLQKFNYLKAIPTANSFTVTFVQVF